MYIAKYWGEYIGGTDDSLNLVAFLADRQKTQITLEEIFAGVGLDKQGGDYRQTTAPLEFTHSNGIDMDFHFAIDLITDLAALLLECKVSGGVNLHDLDDCDGPDRVVHICATGEEHDRINEALRDFVSDPLSYDLCDLVLEEDMRRMATACEELRQELYGE